MKVSIPENKLIEVLRLFWPRAHNRIAWAVVVSGLALISAPLWETLISALIEKKFDLSAYLPNEPLWGTVLVGLGLAYHLGASLIERSGNGETSRWDSEAHDHDKAVAGRFLQMAPEDEVIYQLELLGSDHSANDERWKILSGIERFADLTENEFLNSTIQRHLELLGADCRELTKFVATHFFPMRGGIRAGHTYLYPNLNVDREGTGSSEESVDYHSYAVRLIDLVNSAMKNYRDLRRAIKTGLAM